MSDQPTKTILKNPHELKQHPLRKLLPDTKGTPLVNSLSDEIKRGAKLPPIYIVEPNLVVAGWTRTLAHRAQQKDVECIVVTEDEAAHVAMKENTLRQSFGKKFQLAFAYCPLAIEVVKQAEVGRISSLKNARECKNALTSSLPCTLDELADQIGVSRRLLCDCKQTHDALLEWDSKHDPKKWGDDKEKKTALAFWTARILDDEEPCTPGNARAGIAGSDAGAQGKTKPVANQLELFTNGLAAVGKWGKAFTKFDDKARKDALAAIKKTVAALPVELRDELESEIKRLKREEKENAQ